LAGALGREALLPPREVTRELEEMLARPARQRSKLWEFGTNLHCSLIGTCFSTAELRQVERRIAEAGEHSVHSGKHRETLFLYQWHCRGHRFDPGWLHQYHQGLRWRQRGPWLFRQAACRLAAYPAD
jgi:hypothetical protein